MNGDMITKRETLGAISIQELVEFPDLSLEAAASGLSLEIVSAAQWDKLSFQFDDILPDQTGYFCKSHWGADNVECIIIRQHGELIGGASVIVRTVPVINTGMAVLKWGPIWRKSELSAHNTQYNVTRYRAVVDALFAEYCERRNLHLTIMPAAHPQFGELMSATLSKMRFSEGQGLPSPERYIVNTGQSADDLFASLGQKWRYNLRKARKNSFDIRFVDNEAGLNSFLDLYSAMLERKQFLDSSGINSIMDMFQNANDAVRPRIVLASHDGHVTAGGVFSMAGDMASYMFGATDDRALGLKAGFAMHWWVAEHLCNQPSIKWYDLGGCEFDPGLHQFKKGFVGKAGQILIAPNRYHAANSVLAKTVGSAAFCFRDMKSALTKGLFSVLRAAGR